MTSIERTLLDHAPDAVFWTRQDGSFAYVNRAACAGLGFNRDELLKRTIFDIDPDITPEFWRTHWQSAGSQDISTLQRDHLRKDGTRMPVEVQIRKLPVGDEIVHFSFVRDLTTEKQLELQQQSQFTYLRALFDESPVPQLIIDPDKGDIVEANAAAAEFYGYDAAVLCSMKIQQINDMPDDQIRDEMHRARSRRRTFFEFRHVAADGGRHHVHVYSVPIHREGRDFLHSIVLDQTEIVRSRTDLVRFKDLVQRLPVGVYQATPGKNGVFISVNPALCRIFGFDRENQMIGRRVSDFYADPDDRAKLSRRILQSGHVFRDRQKAVKANGDPILIAVTSQATQLGDDNTIVEGAVEDITALHEARIDLERAHSRALNAMHAAPIPMMTYYADTGRVEAVNQAWCDFSGYPAESLQTLDDWTRLAYGDRAETVKSQIESMIQDGVRVAEGDFEIRRADGELRIWSFHSSPLEFSKGRPTLFMSVATDVTDERAAQTAMRQSEAIIRSASEGIAVTGPDRSIEHVNPAFTRITGYSEHEVRGRNPRILSSGRQGKAFYAEMWSRIDDSDHWQGEIWNRRKSGEIYPEWLSISAVRDLDGKLINYAGIFSDLSELKQSEIDLEHLQHHDVLTGLPNRRLFTMMLAQALDRARSDSSSLAVLVCGLDRFKRINESFSYQIGDQILRLVAEELRDIGVGPLDVARAGSDQFALMIKSNATRQQINGLVARIAALASHPVRIDGLEPLSIQFSVGVSRFPDDGDTPEELMGKAESAMFRAKKINRGGHSIFDAAHIEGTQRKLALETEFRSAIENNALDVHFQPVVAVQSGRIVGAEALARWFRDDGSAVSPAEFIPMAEQSGLIGNMSFQLLESACRATARIRGRLIKGFKLAFNLSAIQLNDETLTSRILGCLAAYELVPEDFELELTESTLMQQAGGPGKALKGLRAAGIRLSIDDFGTGFSSLAYLQEIDAQVLKIDRRFIEDIETSSADARIAVAIISIAHELDMEVVAEGVETQAQLDFLRQNGCDYYQGYLFSKPVGFDEFEDLCRRHQ